MKLFEYQAKEIFREAGIPTPSSFLALHLDEVKTAAVSVGFPCVLKSQVLQGGRGKAGLIRLVKNETELMEESTRLFSLGVPRILVEEAVSIREEIYLSITVDPLASTFVIIASAEGGVEIEELALTHPDKILKEHVDCNLGLSPYQANDMAYRLTNIPSVAKQISSVIQKLYALFKECDAELAEINPLFITNEEIVMAGDGKLIIDENSMDRQKRFVRTRDYYESDMEFEAAQEGIPYLQFDGDISLMCAGAGLTTTVYDLINYEGGSIANYLEFGGPNYRKSVRAMELCLQNDSRVILIVTFGTIARADVMAEGIVEAIHRLKPDRPIVTCIRGTNEQEATRILKDAGLEPLFDTEQAVRKAVKLSRIGGNA